MNVRRRNALILLAVGLLLAGAGIVVATKKTVLALDLKGGVELVFQGRPSAASPKVTPDAIQRAVDIMRQRVDQLGVAEPEIQRNGATQIAVGLPGVSNVQRAEKQVHVAHDQYTSDPVWAQSFNITDDTDYDWQSFLNSGDNDPPDGFGGTISEVA